jgi:hypothetical protein
MKPAQTIDEANAADEADMRSCVSPEETKRAYRRLNPWRGEYRYFQAENVVCIEHFRTPHTPAQKAGKFGWIDRS